MLAKSTGFVLLGRTKIDLNVLDMFDSLARSGFELLFLLMLVLFALPFETIDM
jgi:hypothetical protein